ncbi:MAG: copper resistance protein B [Vicinamibacteraceae bacterium]
MIGPRRLLLAALLSASVTAVPVLAQQTPDPHAGHVHPTPAPPSETPAPPASAPPAALPPFIRPLTDADRVAAFPDLPGHAVHDDTVRAYVLADELEWRSGRSVSGLHWDVDGWIGGDRRRLWLRAEGVGEAGRLDEAHAHVLYGKPIARWWDVVAGVRLDVRPGAAQTWAVAGLQGFAPYRIDVELTGYVGAGGRTQLRADAAHDLRLTQRVIAQTRLEATLNGKADPGREAAAGLAATEFGIRVRYEIRREVAPYVGVTWHRTYFGTAEHARAHREPVATGRLVIGVRVWR